jgi:F-type H+-transporting ATPase subunit gamma
MRPYADKMLELMSGVARASVSTQRLPLLQRRDPETTAILLMTGDRGLAGAFNSNAIKQAERLTERLEREGQEVDIYIVGRRGVAHFNFRERKIAESWSGFTDEPTYADAKKVAAPLIEAIEKDTADGGVDAATLRCALTTREAAIISIALVIFLVAVTDRMRRL